MPGMDSRIFLKFSTPHTRSPDCGISWTKSGARTSSSRSTSPVRMISVMRSSTSRLPGVLPETAIISSSHSAPRGRDASWIIVACEALA